MKKCFYLFAVLLFASTFSFSQDLIVLKKGEQEIMCTIVSINDTSLIYKINGSADQKPQSVNRSEVLSYLIHSKSESTDIKGAQSQVSGLKNPSSATGVSSNNDTIEDRKQGLLGLYKSDEITDGYIIKSDHDTLYGKIKVYNVALNQLAVVFQNDDIPEFTKYTTNDLLGYGYNGITYELVNIKIKGEVTNNRKVSDDKLFLHREVDGASKLYRYYTLNFKGNFTKDESIPPYYLGVLKMHYVITNSSGQIICSKGRTLKGTINRIFADDPQLKDYVYKNGINEQKLFNIISVYNQNQMNTGK